MYNDYKEVDNLAKHRESSIVVKDRIIDVASKLFAQHGVAGISIRKIAEEAGINHALVFRYFGSKDELVTEILRRELSTLKNTFSVIPDKTSDAVQNLRNLLLGFLNNNQDLVKLIVRTELDGLSPESYIDQNSERLASKLANWIESQQTDKNLPNAKLVSIVVIGTLISLVTISPWLITSVGYPLTGSDKRSEDVIDVLMWIIYQAIRAP